MAEDQKIFCTKCKKAMSVKEFYKTNNKTKYPNGYLDQCKKCITMHVDNWNPDTFLWILEEADVPYIPAEWQKLLATYAKDRSKVSGMTIIGRYLSKMQLKQFKDYRWDDSKFLQELEDHKIEEAMKRQGYSASEITQVIEESHQSLEMSAPPPPPQPSNEPVEDYFALQAGEEEDELVNDLTEEDKIYLRLKWGKAYKPDEWVALEQLYQEMLNSYDVQGAGEENTLKLACKSSLKTNQLLDIGDVDGAQKMAKMYDMFMKSGKWTAAQNKKEGGEFLDSIGEFAVLCEKEGFIARFYVDKPNDKVDETIFDLKQYTRTLINEESNLGNLIENAVKEMVKEENKEEDEDIEDELDFNEIDALKDSDFEDFNDFEENQRDEDEEMMRRLLGEEDDDF